MGRSIGIKCSINIETNLDNDVMDYTRFLIQNALTDFDKVLLSRLNEQTPTFDDYIIHVYTFVITYTDF